MATPLLRPDQVKAIDHIDGDSPLAPTINTGIAHREPGVGQVGAGVVKAPLACFEQAVRALADRLGVS